MSDRTATRISTPSSDAPTPAIGRPLRVFARLSFLAEVLIIGTGGAVRLTGSGLGCSDWPLCTPESLTPVLAVQGIHGAIEYGNRTMTGVVGIMALAVLFLTLWAVGRLRAMMPALLLAVGGLVVAVVSFVILLALDLPSIGAVLMSTILLLAVLIGAVISIATTRARRDLVVLAWIVLIGVMAQAVVGGSAVLTRLDAFIVGFHYAASLLLVCVTAAFLVRLRAAPGPRERVVPRWFAVLSHVTGLALAVTIFFGVLTTGNGPHSGDANIERDGFDATWLAHVHSWPGYILAVLLLVLLASAWMLRLPPRRWFLVVTLAVVAQIVVGVIQARDALPPVLVGIHMVLAALSAAAYTVTVMQLKKPAAE